MQLEEVSSTGLFFMPNDAIFVARIREFFVFEPNSSVTPIRSGEEKAWDEWLFSLDVHAYSKEFFPTATEFSHYIDFEDLTNMGTYPSQVAF